MHMYLFTPDAPTRFDPVGSSSGCYRSEYLDINMCLSTVQSSFIYVE